MLRKLMLLVIVLSSLLMAACAQTLAESVTEQIQIPLPDGETPTVTLEIPMGDFEIQPAGETSELVSGTIRYNVELLKPKFEGTRIYQQTNRPIDGQNVVNEWRINLAGVPMSLNLSAGASSGTMELGGLSLENLFVSAGAANVNVAFSEPLQNPLTALNVDSGASSVTLRSIGNASPRTINVDGGAGDVSLDFSGDLQNDVNGSVTIGAATLNLTIPAGVSTLINVDGAATGVNTTGEWSKNGDTYTQEGEGPQIIFNIDAGASTINIRN